MTFNSAETAACQRLVDLAFEEDLGAAGDITSRKIIPPDLGGTAVFVARAPGIVAGLPAVKLVLQTAHTPLVKIQSLVEDGARVEPGDRLAVLSGMMEFILAAERIALNFLQHQSGIATLTRKYVDAVAGLPCQILDTRKTLPGWRLLEKYAVRCGGGQNHRLGLHDGILIKDNHLAALGGDRKSAVVRAVETARQKLENSVPIEVEVDDLEQLEAALGVEPAVILLDNMSLDQMRKAVLRRIQVAPRVLLEASGGVTLENVRAVAETGVDRISVGALTHSAPALDIALDFPKE